MCLPVTRCRCWYIWLHYFQPRPLRLKGSLEHIERSRLPAATSIPLPSPDAGSQFRRIFPGLIQHSLKRLKVTKAKDYHSVPGSEDRWRRWLFIRRARQAAKAAASGRLSHDALTERLREELAFCQVPLGALVGWCLKRLFCSIP